MQTQNIDRTEHNRSIIATGLPRCGFGEMKVGSIFQMVKEGLTCKKVSRTEYRFARNINGRWIAYGETWTMPIYMLVLQVHVQMNQRSDHQKNISQAWMQLGTIARAKKNLVTIGNDNSNRLNLPQLKTLEAARMTLGWIEKQLRHELAANKAAKKLNKAA